MNTNMKCICYNLTLQMLLFILQMLNQLNTKYSDKFLLHLEIDTFRKGNKKVRKVC